MTALLVSVRSAAEAEEALAGGAAIIDVKEPVNGPLGRADPCVIEAVVRMVGGKRLVTAALGDYPPAGNWYAFPGVCVLKLGMAASASLDWRSGLPRLRTMFEEETSARFIPVAYADWARAGAPPPYDVMKEVIAHRFAAFLVDTWQKDGTTLLDWFNETELNGMAQACREAAIPLGFAGSIGITQIRELLPLRPDLIAVRGAACVGGRNGTVSREKVAALVELITSAPS